MFVDDAAAQTYREEARDLLAELEATLLELEIDPLNAESVSKAFRALHTIKGSGAMFGFEEVARFTHDIETVFDRVRDGRLALDRSLLRQTLAAKDHLQELLQGPPAGTEASVAKSDAILLEFKGFLPEAPRGGAEEEAANIPKSVDTTKTETFWIRFRPAKDIFFSGAKPLGLLEELSELGSMRVLFHNEDVPCLEDHEPESLYGWWDMVFNAGCGRNALEDVFMFVDGDGGLMIRRIGDAPVRASDLESLIHIVGEHPDENLDALEQKLAQHLREGIKRRLDGASKAAPAAGDKPREGGSIRVDAARLDKLVNLVGEMVIIQSRLSQRSATLRDGPLSQLAEDMERLTDELRDNALGLRMLPVGMLFGVFRRLVHDLSASLGHEVEFETEGGETEMDKTVIDRLKDPLVHILRNSMDHGVEAPEVREAAGKPRAGKLLLKAGHAGGEVVIVVKDDGAGINVERVRTKALERGLVSPGDELSDKDALNLIFEPGFSTAVKVSSVSGRGVGMDVVKKSILELRGSVEIESDSGQGTTLTIRLPLTLAIIDGLNVLVGGESYILPLVNVEACQDRFISGEVKECGIIERMGRMIPCVSLRRLLGTPGRQPAYERILIATVDGESVGLAVDTVVGRQQAVIKSLSGQFKNQRFISGTTVNGDGGISLILDAPQLIRYAAEHSRTNRPA